MTSFLVMFIRGSSLIIKFTLTLFIARYLSFEDLGAYGLVGAACAVAPSTIGFALMYTLSRKAVMLKQSEILVELFYYIKCTILAYTVALMVVSSIGVQQNQLLFYMIVLLIVFLEHLNADFYTLLQNLSKPLAANLLHFIRSSVWMMVFMLSAFFMPELRSVEVLLLFWVIGSVLALFCFAMIIKDWQKPNKKQSLSVKSWFVKEFNEAKVAYFTNFLRSISQYLNHFLITIFLGVELTGVYVYFMQVITAMGNLLQTGIIQVTRPKLIKYFRSNDSMGYWSMYKKCMVNTMLTAMIMALCASPSMYILTHYVVNKPLAIEWLPVFSVLLVLFVIGNISEVNKLVFYSQHRDDLILFIFLIGFPVSIVLQVLLIYLYGFWGIVLASFPLSIFGLLMQKHFFKRLLFDKN